MSEAQLVESEGGHGEDALSKPHQGTQTAGAVTELLNHALVNMRPLSISSLPVMFQPNFQKKAQKQ